MSGVIFRSSRRALAGIRFASVAFYSKSSIQPLLRTLHYSSAWKNSTKHVRSFASGSYPQHIKLVMPALSPTMERGNLAKWIKKEGDMVKPGETLAEVETDKATVAFDSVEEGYLAKILVAEGSQDVPLGKLVAILVDTQEDIAAFKDFTDSGAKPAEKSDKPPPPESEKPKPPPPEKEPKPSEPASTSSPSPPKPTPTPQSSPAGDRVIASPLARREANEKGVDLRQVQGSGDSRRILAADVQEYLAAQPKTTAAPASKTTAAAPSADGYVDKPLSNIRKVIAQRLSQSKQQVPHYYVSVDINMDKVLKLRADLNSKLGKDKDGKDKDKLSVNDFVIKAAALALRQVPTVNASWLDTVIREYKYVDISVAVSTDTGLITPIVKDADLKGLSAISKEVRDLATRARQNKLQPAEFQGGTFTISNLGMFGVTNFSAIINPPQSAILAVGATVKRVEVNPADKTGDNPYKVSNVMGVTLSADHRVIDGALGAVWLSAFRNYLEEPTTMLL